jgi:hypothetical protein
MSLVLRDGDLAVFDAQFGIATVVVKDGTLRGTGGAKIAGAAVCVAGDEKRVVVTGCAYAAPPYAGGVGTLTIESLGGDQSAGNATSGRKPLLLRGQQFIARFTVTTPAQTTSSPPTPDTILSYVGQGRFVASRQQVRAR